MKRSDFFIRLTTAVLFLAVVSYIGVSIYNSAINTFITAPAIAYIVEDTFPAEGYIVRTETVITDGGEAILPIAGEGEKVAVGQAVATEYLSREAIEIASRIHELRMRIAMLEQSTEVAESTRRESVMALSNAVHSGDLSALDEMALNIETYIFTDNSALAEALPSLQAQLRDLESRSGGARTIYAPVSGIYSHVVDGWEFVRPGDVAGISPSRLGELFSARTGIFNAGKLVTEFSWYFAAIMDAENAIHLQAGGRIAVQFSGAYNMEVEMRIESVSRREDGECLVVFSSDRGVHEIASLRALRADVVFNVTSGIRVPKEAIHLDDDGTTFIYLQTGVRAERVDVEILVGSGDYYLVRDGAESGTPLRAGSTIIVRANNLYHGKIVA